MRPIDDVLKTSTPRLLAIPGVVGVGEGQLEGKPAVQVMVVELTSELRRRLPTTLNGHPVQIVETGVIRAQPDSSSR